MEILEQSHQVLTPLLHESIYGIIERAGRTAYKSEDKITEGSAIIFIQNILKRGHESVLEHASVSVRFITDRGVTHELVRHRLCAFTQESTRYCNYYKRGMQFIKPAFWNDMSKQSLSRLVMWELAMSDAERCYNVMIQDGCKPEEARSVLPNSLKTEIVVTANIREWRHIFRLRTALTAHPQMRALMTPTLREFKEALPALFTDFEVPNVL